MELNAPDWVRENYPKYAHCEKRPLPHVNYKILSVKTISRAQYYAEEAKRAEERKQAQTITQT